MGTPCDKIDVKPVIKFLPSFVKSVTGNVGGYTPHLMHLHKNKSQGQMSGELEGEFKSKLSSGPAHPIHLSGSCSVLSSKRQCGGATSSSYMKCEKSCCNCGRSHPVSPYYSRIISKKQINSFVAYSTKKGPYNVVKDSKKQNNF